LALEIKINKNFGSLLDVNVAAYVVPIIENVPPLKPAIFAPRKRRFGVDLAANEIALLNILYFDPCSHCLASFGCCHIS
jgi:hypothetical protein